MSARPVSVARGRREGSDREGLGALQIDLGILLNGTQIKIESGLGLNAGNRILNAAHRVVHIVGGGGNLGGDVTADGVQLLQLILAQGANRLKVLAGGGLRLPV